MYFDKTNTTEIELKATGAFGLNVDAQLNIDGTLHLLEFSNLTELHWMYRSGDGSTRVAFESSIHGIGYTYEVSQVVRLEVKVATKLELTC